MSQRSARLRTGDRPTILHIVPRFQNDGTMSMVQALLRDLDREKYRVVLCALNKGNATEEGLRELGVKVVLLDMRHWLGLDVIWRLAKLIKSERVMLVHTHRARPDFYGRIAGRLAGVPWHVCTQHYVDEWAEKGRIVHILYRLFFQWTMGWCDKIVAISTAEKNRLVQEIGLGTEKLRVIYNGVDVEKFSLEKRDRRVRRHLERLSIPPEHRIVGTVGFLVDRKGIHYLIEAAQSILEDVPDTTFLIVGGGPREKSLKELALSRGVGERVVFAGHSDRVEELIPLMDVFCFTSVWEPFGLALVEAMASGKPVVAFESGAVPEIVKNEANGRLVSVGNASALADAVIMLLQDGELRANMGRESRRRAERFFSSKRAADAYSELYDSFLTHSPRA